MSKVINLDKFNEGTKVVLGGKEYTIRPMTIQDMLESDLGKRIDEAETDAEKFSLMMEFAGSMTDIPEDVLRVMSTDQFNALIAACQGIGIEAK